MKMKFTREQIINYIYNSEPAISFYRSAMSIGFWPDFPDYKVETLAWYLEEAKIQDINLIDSLLSEHKDVLNKYIENLYENRKNTWRITPGFLCALALIAKFPELFTTDWLVEKGFDAEIAKIIHLSAKPYSSKLA